MVIDRAVQRVRRIAQFDTIIGQGGVIDGTGAAASYADVGILDGRVAKVGNLKGDSADGVIDAKGKIVALGHITQHAHYDAQLMSING